MRIVLDLGEADSHGFGGGRASFPEPFTLHDNMAIVLTMGEVELHLSYGQFEDFLEGVLRWHWSHHGLGGEPFDLAAEVPPPSWEAHARLLSEAEATDRWTIAEELRVVAEGSDRPDPPPVEDKAALGWFLAGQRAGVVEGLLHARDMVLARATRLDRVEMRRDASRGHGAPGRTKGKKHDDR